MPRQAKNAVPRHQRQRRIADCLATAPGPVAMAALVAAVYGGAAPPGAITSIRNGIAALRSAGAPIVCILRRGYTILTEDL